MTRLSTTDPSSSSQSRATPISKTDQGSTVAYSLPPEAERDLAHLQQPVTQYSGPRAVAVLLIPVIQENQVGLVVIKRGYGRKVGEWALPGGYVPSGNSWEQTGAAKALQKASISLPTSTTISPFGVHSVRDGEELVIYGVTTPLRADSLSSFTHSQWATDRRIIFGPEKLAFPTHTLTVKSFFSSKAAQILAEYQQSQELRREHEAAQSTELPEPTPLIDPQMPGLSIRELRTFFDDRGYFREVVRHSNCGADGEHFAQMSHSEMVKNTVKAWHFHHKQFDWWYVAAGVVKAVVYDNREESPTYRKQFSLKLGQRELDPEAREACVVIPPGMLHGLKVLTPKASLVYLTSQVYDPSDEGRLPYNWQSIHNWGDPASVIVNEMDKGTFFPIYERTWSASRFAEPSPGLG